MPVLLIMAILQFAAGCGGNDDDAGSAEQGMSTESAAPTTSSTEQATQPSPTATDEATMTSPSATDEATEPLPTANPTDGVYRRLTFEEAQALTDFELVMPDPLPSSLEFASATISQPPAPPPPPGTPAPTGADAFGEPKVVGLSFRSTSNPEQWVLLTETVRNSEVGGGAREAGSLTIEGVEVSKYTRESDGGILLIYEWDIRDLDFTLYTPTGPDSPTPITAAGLEELIAGTIG